MLKVTTFIGLVFFLTVQGAVAAPQDALRCSGWREDEKGMIYYTFSVSPLALEHIGPYQIEGEIRRKIHVPGTGEPHFVLVGKLSGQGEWNVGAEHVRFRFDQGELSAKKGRRYERNRDLFWKDIAEEEVIFQLGEDTVKAVCEFKKRNVQLSLYMATFLGSSEYQVYLEKAKQQLPEGYRLNIVNIYSEPADPWGRETVSVVLEAEDTSQAPSVGYQFGTIVGLVKNPGPRSSYKVLEVNFKKAPVPQIPDCH